MLLENLETHEQKAIYTIGSRDSGCYYCVYWFINKREV